MTRYQYSEQKKRADKQMPTPTPIVLRKFFGYTFGKIFLQKLNSKKLCQNVLS